MLSIEYIWSALAITQALAVTFQVGSKLLSSVPPNHTDPIGILQNNSSVTNSTTERAKILTIQPTTFTNPSPQQQAVDINHGIDEDDCSNENDLLLCAFRLAIRIGSISSLHLPQQHGDDFLLSTLELVNGSNEYDQNNNNNDMQWSPPPTVAVRRCVRTVTSAAVVEPYRLSMIPVDIRRDTTNDQNIGSSSSSNHSTDTTDYHNAGKELDTIQAPTTSSRPQEPTTNTSSSSLLFHEYYETQCSLVRNRTATCSVMVRTYAPNIMHQLRSYYSNESYTNVRRRPSPLPVSFEESILQRTYTFLKTNSKGSQRSKNVFFYTNGGLTPPSRRSNRRRIHHRPYPQTVPNYLIKSIKKDEFDTLLGTMLPKYVEYMEQYGSISLLNRIYGLYEIVIPAADDHASQTYYVVVFNAVFDPSTVHLRIYDIKGSTVGRCTRTTTLDEEMAGAATTAEYDGDHSSTHHHDHVKPSTSVTYKDLDLIQDIRNNAVEHNGTTQSLLQLSPTEKHQLVQQLQRDVQFLSSSSVMDYSLLIGIEQLPNNVERQQWASPVRRSFWRRRQRRNHSHRVWDVDIGKSPLSVQYGTHHGRCEKYSLGVIDFLQPYNAKKEIEYRWKSLIYEKNAYSCIPPDLYAQRFIDFIDQHVV